jgi:hypothetical protein
MSKVITGNFFNLLFKNEIFIKFPYGEYFFSLRDFPIHFSDCGEKNISFVQIPNEANVSSRVIFAGTAKVFSCENLKIKYTEKIDKNFKFDEWLISNNILKEENIYDYLKDILGEKLLYTGMFSEKIFLNERALDICFDIFVNYYEKKQEFIDIYYKDCLTNEKFYSKILDKYPEYMCRIHDGDYTLNLALTYLNKNPYNIVYIPKYILENEIFIKENKKRNKWDDKSHHLIKNTEFKRIVFTTFMCLNKKYKGNISLFLHIFSLLFDYYFI